MDLTSKKSQTEAEARELTEGFERAVRRAKRAELWQIHSGNLVMSHANKIPHPYESGFWSPDGGLSEATKEYFRECGRRARIERERYILDKLFGDGAGDDWPPEVDTPRR